MRARVGLTGDGSQMNVLERLELKMTFCNRERRRARKGRDLPQPRTVPSLEAAA